MAANEVIESVQDEGFTIVQNPAKAKVDIVFIHGVVGKQPWTSDTGVFWPKMLLAPKLPDARILSYRYTETIDYSDGITDASAARIVYGRLIGELADNRTEKESETRPILFVAHCLGGVILEGAIVDACDDDSQKELVSCIRGILLLGTPHFKEESDPAAKKYFEYASGTENDKLPEQMQDLISISQKFVDFKKKNANIVEIKSFYASKATAVNEGLAQLPSAPRPQLLSCTHLKMSQFENDGGSDFKQVLRALTTWLKNIDQESKEHDGPKHDEPRVDFSGSSYNSGMQIGSNKSPISGLSFSTTHKA